MNADHRAQEAAASRLGLIDRSTACAVGLSDAMIQARLRSGYWRQVQPGVYLLASDPPSWEQRQLAGCLAAGPLAAASHRAAVRVWALEGLDAVPIEVTAPYGKGPVPTGVLMHRSRRLDDRDVTTNGGIPVTNVERTLIDVARFVPPVVVEKAFESAVRKRLTTATKVGIYLEERGIGLPGWRKVHRYLARRSEGRPAGSPAEVEMLHFLAAMGFEEPVRQYTIKIGRGIEYVVDLAWPRRHVALEWEGFDVHSGGRAFASMLDRANRIQDAGWTLRQFSGSTLRADPGGVAHRLAQTLANAAATRCEDLRGVEPRGSSHHGGDQAVMPPSTTNSEPVE